MLSWTRVKYNSEANIAMRLYFFDYSAPTVRLFMQNDWFKIHAL